MAEWSKALDLSSSIRKNAWVRTPLEAVLLAPAGSKIAGGARGALPSRALAELTCELSSWPNG